MPGGDRTGPYGQGARTGRGAGYCAGNEAPGFAYGGRRGQMGGRGLWCRGGRGRGVYGPGHGAYTVPSREDEAGYLESLRSSLERELEAVKSRIASISGAERDD